MSTTLFYKDLVGDGKVGIGSTATPTANLQVMGNIYASNSLTTTNVFANTLNFANASATGSVTASTFYGVLAGSNTISSSNLLVASGLPASIVQGSNVFVFSNASGGANVMVMNSLGRVGVGTTSPATALDVYTGTINAATVTASSATLTSLGVLTGNITTANIVSLNVTGDANIAQNLRVLSNLYTNNLIMGSNISTDTGYGNVYVSANLVVNGNVFSLNSSGGSGTSQGITYTLGGNYTLGAAFATGTAGPSMNAYHINMSSFTAEAVAAVSAFSAASGMFKFATAGLYQVQMVLVGDQPLVKVGVGSSSLGSFPPGSTATSGYLYVYNVTAGSSPSTVITIPLTITDISKWYYLDAFFSIAAGDPTLLYPTAPPGGSSAGTNYGTFVQVSPFGNYLSSATGIASALLTNCSTTSNLSGVYSSNAYRIAMTSSNGWTVNGTSTSLAITTNGNFQVNQTGIYEVNMCLNTVGNTPVQFQIGSLATDALSPSSTTPEYLYTYAPMYTQDPTTVIQLPLNITNISNVYFIECSFPGTVTGNVALTQTSTFVSIKPIGGYINTGTNPWIQQGSFVYYNGGNVGIGTSSPATALDVYTGTINAAAVVATSGNIATMNVGYLTVNSAVVYGTSTLNVYGTSNLTNVTVTGTITATSLVGTHYGTLAGSNTVAASTVTATSLVGTMYGALAGSNTVAASTVTATSLVGTMYGVLAGSNTVSASTVSATSLVGTMYGVLAGSNTVAASTVTATSLYGTLAGSNTVAASSVTVSGNTSVVGNVTVTSDASSNNYVLARRVPTGSLDVTQYVTGSVPLTTTTNLIQKYLSNAAQITSNTGTGTITQALRLPGTANSSVNFQSGGSSVALIATNTTNVFVEAWINPGVTTSGIIASVGTGSQLWNFYLSTGSFLNFNAAGGGSQTASSLALSAGTWYHVAVSLTPALTTKANIWVNGTQTTYSSTMTSLPAALASANVYIGQQFAGGNFSGNIADVRIWSGGIIPTTATRPSGFTAAAAPFGISQPAYITGTPTLQMSLQSQYFPGASTSPYGPCLTLPGTVGSYYSNANTAYDTNWKTNGFTLEAWVNYASFANSNLYYLTNSGPYTIGHFSAPAATSLDWAFGALTNGQIGLYWDQGSATTRSLNTFSTITTGSWNHIMVQSNGSNVYIAVNGVFQALKAFGTSYTPAGDGTIAPAMTTTLQVTAGTPLVVGQYGSAQGPNYAIAKARLTFGTSGSPSLGNVYSSGNFTANPNFATVPAGATIAWSLDTQYALPTYPSFFDVPQLPQQLDKYGAEPVVVGGVTSNVLGPYPTTDPQFDSVRFDGTGYIDYGNAASSSLTTNIWASNWTIEAWVYPTNVSGAPTIIQRTAVSTYTYDWSFWIKASNQIAFVSTPSLGGAGTYNNGSVSYPVNLNTWSHVAATSDGTSSNVYVNGFLANTMPISAMAKGFNPQIATQIGTGAYGTNYNFLGNLADVRVSNVALYTGSTYTVPTAPFATDSNTLLLLKSLAGQTGTTLEVQGRGLNAVSLGATRSVQSYPPAPMSSYLLDTTSNASVTYGQGKYVASASSEYTGQPAWLAFDGNGATAWGSNLGYASGVYTGSVVTVDNLGNACTGEWIQFQMPVSVILSSYSLVNINNTYQPTLSWLLGSRDGINWTLVFKYAGSPSGASSTYTVSATQGYNYYRLVVGSVVSANATNMYSYVLNGTEESLCITNDSKVGVGIANPQRSLEVAGDLVVGGTISGGAGMGSFRNRIINGDMRIAQRGTSNVLPSTSAGIYTTVDRWAIFTGTLTSSMTMNQNNLSFSDAPYQQGLRQSSNLVVNSAGTSTSFAIWQVIEGYNAQDLVWGTPFGSPVTLSFWVKASITGNYTFHIISAGTDYSYLAPYTVVNPNTWEYKTLTIPPPPNGSTWGTGTAAWGYLQFRFIQPSASTGTSGWSSGVLQKLYGTVNLVDVQGATWAITGVQLERGTVATPFEFRNYAQELQLCQRYYQKSYNIGTVPGTNVSGTGGIAVTALSTTELPGSRFTVPMRANPVVVMYNPYTATTTGVTGVLSTGADTAAATAGTIGEMGFRLIGSSGLTTGLGYQYHYTANAEL